VHGGGSFDFAIDRHGWASYSHASGDVEPSPGSHPVRTFLACLNIVIQHLRDDVNLFWIHKLESDDLFELTVGDEGHFVAQMLGGRTGGVGPEITGLLPEAEARFKERLASRSVVETWRILQQDAREALHTGHYDQATILNWSALETAARTQLPRLARAAGLGPPDVWARLQRKRLAEHHTHEQSVECAGAPHVFNYCANCQASYDANTLASSAKGHTICETASYTKVSASLDPRQRMLWRP
jgi:hypothetical protein